MSPQLFVLSKHSSRSETAMAWSGTARAASRARFAPLPVYIGPPDSVSNLRPVVYGAAEDRRRSAAATHPYSLSEFSVKDTGRPRGPLAQYTQRLAARLEAAQLQARLQTMWLDQFNQRFWTDNNTRFQQAVAEYEHAAGLVVGEAPLEQVAPFYRAWLATNAARLRSYNRTLWLSTARVVAAQAHYTLLRWYARSVASLAGMW